MALIDEAQDVVIIDQKILEAARELREHIEQAYGIRAHVDIVLWYPPKEKIKLDGNWEYFPHKISAENPSKYPYACHALRGDRCEATIYTSDHRQDGMLK